MKRTLLSLVLCLFSIYTYAQTKISGKVFDEYLEPFAGAVIKTVNSQTTSNFDGEFTLVLKKQIPITIEVTSVGYQKEIVNVTALNQEINIILKETSALDEVVVSASRTPERILESPVTIERMGIKDIKNTASVNFYNGLENLKGVDINASSLGFKSVNTRGFAPIENVRFVQLIDGVDSSVPALNFATGNMIGSPDIDIQSTEILPGAASALYGANAFNGILLIKTKNPFDYKGISVNYRTGITNQEVAGNKIFQDASIRAAYALNEKIAVKATFSLLSGEEWHAEDYRNSTKIGGVITEGNQDSPNYDGINTYGDEVGVNILSLAKRIPNAFTSAQLSLIPNVIVKRTGYKEVDLIDNKAKKINFSGALHYRPFGKDNLEIIWNSRFNKGNNMYHGQSRYFQKNFYVQQHKLEFVGKNFFLRGYYSQNDAGDSYNTRFAGVNINRAWKPYGKWFTEYIIGYLRSRQTGKDENQALIEARKIADTGRLLPNTPEFNTVLNRVIEDSNTLTGAKFKDKSDFYHADANYNFKNQIDWAEIQIGGAFRAFTLNSEGNIFTDSDSRIRFNEFGIYSQIQKKILEDRLKFTGSIRYDKSTNFKGNFSPRLSISYAFGKEKQRNLRLSFQTAFRDPTSQEQYIGLFTGSGHILGTAPDNLDRYVVNVTNKSGTTSTLTGRDALENSYTANSFREFIASRDASKLVKANYNIVQPEELSSFELGYRAILDIDKRLVELDVNTYYNNYKNLIVFRDVFTPNYSGSNAFSSGDFTRFDIRTNSSAKLNSYGFGIGLKTSIFNDFNLGVSYNWDDFTVDKSSDPNFKPGFNLAKHKVKLQFGKESLFKNFGFNVNARWQDSYLWQSTFLDGIIDARTVIDAQLNYRVPSIKSRFKLGGTNLMGKEYVSAPGTGKIGSTYYISWTIND